MRTEVKYVTREHEAKIAAQNHILQLNKDIIYRQHLLNVFIGAFAILLVVFILVLIRNIKDRKLANIRLEHRVRQRTMELEVNKGLLERSLDERNLQMARVSDDVRGILVTIKGLCFLGMKDTNPSAMNEYMQKIDLTSDRLLTIINRFVGH
jgi:hypothetical protein